MNKRRALFLALWLTTWIVLPAYRAELLTAATGALIIYLALLFNSIAHQRASEEM